MIELACRDLMDKSNTPQALANAISAKMWLYSDEEEYIFSFRRLCEALNLDPDNLRKQIEQRIKVSATDF